MKLSFDQDDAITEIVNIGAGKAAASLSQLIGERITLSIPGIVVCGQDELEEILSQRAEQLDTSVVQDFSGSIRGQAVLAFPRLSGVKLGQVLAGLDETPGELDLDLSEILEEVGNIVLNGVLGSISNLLATGLTYSVPRLHADTDVRFLINARSNDAAHAADNDSTGVAGGHLLANAQFEVASRSISGSLLIMFGLGSLETVLEAALGQVASE